MSYHVPAMARESLEYLAIRPDGTYDQQAFDPEADGKLEWVQWNKRRDAMLERGR